MKILKHAFPFVSRLESTDIYETTTMKRIGGSSKMKGSKGAAPPPQTGAGKSTTEFKDCFTHTPLTPNLSHFRGVVFTHNRTPPPSPIF
jgi:hypothetical protein